MPTPRETELLAATRAHLPEADKLVLSFENYDTRGYSRTPNRAMAQAADAPDPVPQNVAEQERFNWSRSPLNPDRARVEAGEQRERQLIAAANPKSGSAPAALARAAVTRAGNALASPVVGAGQALEHAGVPNAAAHLDAGEAVADAESLIRGETTPESRERALLGSAAHPTATKTGEAVGDIAAGLVTAGALKATPAVRAEAERAFGGSRASQRGMIQVPVSAQHTPFQKSLMSDLMDQGVPYDDALDLVKTAPSSTADPAWKQWQKDAKYAIDEYDAYFDYLKNEIKAGAKNFQEAEEWAKKKGTYNTGADYEAFYNKKAKPAESWANHAEQLEGGSDTVPPAAPQRVTPKERRLAELAGRASKSDAAADAADFISQHPGAKALHDYTFKVEGINNMLTGRSGPGGKPGWDPSKAVMLDARAKQLSQLLADTEAAGHTIKGTTFRGLTLPRATIDEWVANGGFQNKSFMSASADAGYASSFGPLPGPDDARVLLRMRSQSGVPISGRDMKGNAVSAYGSAEDEVLFRPGKRWKILAKHYDPDTDSTVLDVMEVKKPGWGEALPVTGAAAAAGSEFGEDDG